jgi:hypothetical protein
MRTKAKSTRPREYFLFISIMIAVLAFAIMTLGAAHGAAHVDRQPISDTTVPEWPTRDAANVARVFDPFPPATESLTDTVQAVVDAYEEAAGNPLVQSLGPMEIANHWTNVRLPIVMAERVTATPTMPPTLTPTEPPTLTPTTPPSPTPTTPPSPTPTRTREPEPAIPADIAVVIWPSPSIRVARNGTLGYEVRVKNYGAGTANGVQVRLPYRTNQLSVIDSQLRPGDWVSEVSSDRVAINFGRFAPGEYRTGTIIFRAINSLPDNAVIDTRASFSWSDDGVGGSGWSNWAPVLGGGQNDSAPWVWLSVNPVGGYPGTVHRFYTDRFIPGEGIRVWLNTPNGVQGVDLRPVADSMGRVTVDFRNTGLVRGAHSLVLNGARSNLTAIATFYVW